MAELAIRGEDLHNMIVDLVTSAVGQMAVAVGGEIAARLEKHFVVEPTLTLEESAKELKISVTVMRQLCRERKIRAVRLDKSYRIRVRDLNAYLDERTIEADGGAA